jgi:hypothetical protein
VEPVASSRRLTNEVWYVARAELAWRAVRRSRKRFPIPAFSSEKSRHQRASVRQKFHLSTCAKFRSRLYAHATDFRCS